MNRYYSCSLAALLALAACFSPTLNSPVAQATKIELRAKRAENDVPGQMRYVVPNLPSGHGYQPGRVLALYTSVNGLSPQPVGAVHVVAAYDHSLELVVWWLDPQYLAHDELMVREMPEGHHFGNKLGRLLPHENNRRRVRLNMGKSHGVEVGNLYKILGNPLGDADLQGRTLGRDSIGVIQIQEVGRGTASAIIVRGEAPANSYAVFMGHEALSQRPVVRLAIAPFQGSLGEAYTWALNDALVREFQVHAKGDIEVEVYSRRVVTSEGDARALGLDAVADVVLWGSASSVGGDMSVRTKTTFIDEVNLSGVDWGRDDQFWQPEKIPEERIFRNEGDEITRRAQNLAFFLAGVMYYKGFEYKLDGAYGRAAEHFNLLIENDANGDYSPAAEIFLFYCLQTLGDYEGADQIASRIEKGAAKGAMWQRALGISMRAQVRLFRGDLDAALELAKESLDTLGADEEQQMAAAFASLVAYIYLEQERYDESLTTYHDKVLPVFSASGDRLEYAEAMAGVARVHWRRGDFDEALRIFMDEVLPVVDEFGERRYHALVWGDISEIHVRRGELDEALRICIDIQIPVYTKIGDRHSLATVNSRVAGIYTKQGRLDEALEIYSEQAMIYNNIGDFKSRAEVMGNVADIYQLRGDTKMALRIHREEELPAYSKLGDTSSLAIVMGKIAEIHSVQGDLSEALRIHRDEVLPVHLALGDRHSQAATMASIASIYLRRGKLSEALKIYSEDVLPIYEDLGDLRSAAVTMGHIADTYTIMGDFGKALDIRIEEQLPAFEKLGDKSERALTVGKVADILYMQGELDKALRIRMEEELPIFKELGDSRSYAITMGKIADIYFERGDVEESLRIRLEEELPVFSALGDKREYAVTLGKISAVRMVQGDLNEALRILELEILPIFIELSAVREVMYTQVNIALVLLNRGKPGDRGRAAELMMSGLATAREFGFPEEHDIIDMLREHELQP